jgi:OmcA/MtrC family decaheme c-type cytochrome
VCWDATNLATTAFNNFGDVEYPGSSCEQCHLPGTYNFANAANQAAIPNLLWTYTYGTPSAGPQLSPYVTAGTSYGAAIGNALNLVSTPITAACASCHDSAAAQTHFAEGGGKYYAVRGGAASLVNTERCLSCHGAGQFMDVAKIHEK